MSSATVAEGVAERVAELVAGQRAWFRTGATRDYTFRIRQLEALTSAISSRESEIMAALATDLHKGSFESFTSEIGMVYEEARYTRRHLRSWMKARKVSTPLVHAPARSRIRYRPLGISVILAPWNYPFQLAIAPLIGAISAGNCAIVKPSEFAPATSAVIQDLINATFDPRYIACLEGDGSVAAELTAAPVDHIFFTGSTRVGSMVMRAAADRLVPVTLELGGKSPAIVSEHARVEVAARRIAWGKFLNAGQTCVAPDYVCVHRSVEKTFVSALATVITMFFGEDAAQSEDFGRIINETHYNRLSTLIDRQSERAVPVIGGRRADAERFIAPTVYTGVAWDAPIMEDEIFGPVLPVLVYDDFEELVETIAARPQPLAAYLFTENRSEIAHFEEFLPFGGAAVNDTIVHLVNPELPFGGCGPSGHGSYHGFAGFRAFSHEASVMQRSTRVDPSLKYPPYGNALALLRKVMKP